MPGILGDDAGGFALTMREHLGEHRAVPLATGHRSREMINRYRRAARTWGELGLGPLAALDEALPELRLPRAASTNEETAR